MIISGIDILLWFIERLYDIEWIVMTEQNI